MKKWYESKLIGLGLVAILGVVADGLAQGWDWRHTVAAAIASLIPVFRLITKEGIDLTGKAPAILFLLAVGSVSCSPIDLPPTMTADQVKVGVCAAMAMDECFGDALISVGISKATCEGGIDAILQGKLVLDVEKVKALPNKCSGLIESVRRYVESVKDAGV